MAAGLGFKTFNTGDVLTAADVNGYLMQGVLVFADATARDAAITSPQEGQFAYTKDNNSLWYYTGSAWAASGATGDIEGVTAGTGISGGGTSGTVTITNSMATAIDAKGDLIVGTGADTFSRLAVGTNDYVLTAASGEATGLKWAAPSTGGGLTLLSTTTLSGTSTTIGSIDQTYNQLLIILKLLNLSSSTNSYVKVRPNATTNLVTYAKTINTGSTISTQGASADDIDINWNVWAASNTNNIMAIQIFNYAATDSYKAYQASGSYQNGAATSNRETLNMDGSILTNSAISSIEVLTGALATWSGGTVLIYGVK